MNNVTQAIQKTTFPLYSLVRNEKERLRSAFVQSVKMMFFLIVPVMLGMILMAKPLIIVLLTDRWSGAVIYLQLFCVLGLLKPFAGVNMHLLLSKGRSDIALRLAFLKYSIHFAILLVSFRYGITYIIAGQILGSVIEQTINTQYTKKYIDMSFISQLRAILPYFLASIPMMVSILCLYCLIGNDVVLLISQIVLGGSVYLLVCYACKFEALTVLGGFVSTKLHVRGNNPLCAEGLKG